VIVPSGYNSADGEGKVFFIDAITGSLLYTMTTGYGSPGTPAGLAHIAGYTKDYQNQMVEQIYGGDLFGHFWRFDVSDANEANWKVQEIAHFTDKATGQPQPVTTPPQIEIDIANGVDRWVFVGTGRLLDDPDSADLQGQTFYAIRDGTQNAPKVFASTLARTDLVELATATEKLDGLTSKPANGWYEDLPTGQRIVTPIQAVASIVGYVATSPQLDPCLTGEPATVYVRQFSNGMSLLGDPNGTGRVASIYSAGGGVGLEIVVLADNTSPSGGQDYRVAVTLGDGTVKFFKIILPDILLAHRMSWRLLGQ
jgi:type IV pilus assembly protein PilY1